MVHLFIFAFSLLLPVAATAADAVPTRFNIQYQPLSKGALFYVQQNHRSFAKVMRSVGESEHFCYQTMDDHVLATVEIEKVGSTTIGHMYGPDGDKIGSFTATIYTVYPDEFMLYDASDELIAIGWMNWICNRFTLTDPQNDRREYATFTRPYFKLHSDSWHAEIKSTDVINPAAFVLISAYQTSLNLGLEGYVHQHVASR
ncbi:MAG: hypothetical protein S4CHLAM2_06640 [Chlamydiales bacterium]|nr:hypothetical protein [Chlamydiales bacterium]